MNNMRLAILERRMGYQFSDRDLLVRAITHASYGDGQRREPNNERLEFLGDRVLGLITADLLYRETTDSEGRLARRLNALVRKESCAEIARAIQLGEVMRMSRSEEKQGGRNKTSILGDACEALLAAIYLDGGYEAAKTFYLFHWQDLIKKVLKTGGKDPKTQLQEMAAQGGLTPPVYQVVERSGPDHRPHFLIRVEVAGFGEARGEGRSKKLAEARAAEHLLEKMMSI